MWCLPLCQFESIEASTNLLKPLGLSLRAIFLLLRSV